MPSAANASRRAKSGGAARASSERAMFWQSNRRNTVFMKDANAADHMFVVPAYGRSPFLSGCLASLRNQTRSSRILITTSTPDEEIEEAAERFAVPIIVNPDRRGIGADWNFALAQAGGARFVTLAHQDDTYEPEFLEETLGAFSLGPAALAFTGYQEIDDEGRPISSKISRVKHLVEAVTLGKVGRASGLRLQAFLALGNPLPCSSVTLDRSRLADFQFSEVLKSNLDWDAWWRLTTAGETFARSPRRMVGRRHNPQTETSRLIQDGTRGREDLMMFRRIWPKPVGDIVAWVYRAGY